VKKILLVDDSRLVLEIEKNLLSRSGAELLVASTGGEALKLAVEFGPDLILLDFVLPDITGDKICAQLKRDPRTNGIPIIMVTTKAKDEDIERCRQAGCDDFAAKPLRHQELLDKVSKLLRTPTRVSKRVMVRAETRLETGGEILFGTSNDLSASGMYLETAAKLEKDDTISMHLLLPGEGEILIRGKIAWSETLLFYKKGYGIKFVGLPEETSEKIRRFLEARAL